MYRVLPIFIVAAVMGVACGGSSAEQAVSTPAVTVRPGAHAPPEIEEPSDLEPAPDFTVTTLDGGTFTLSAERGTPVVLNFWAPW